MNTSEIVKALKAIRAEARKPVLARTATLVYRKGINALIARLKAEPEPLKLLDLVEGQEIWIHEGGLPVRLVGVKRRKVFYASFQGEQA